MHRGRGGEAECLAHLAHRRAVAFFANARFDAVKHCLLPFRHFLSHIASFHKSVHLFEIVLTGTFVRSIITANKGSTQEERRRKMSRYEFPVIFALSTLVSFFIFFA